MLKKFDIIYNNLLSSHIQLLMVKFNVLKKDTINNVLYSSRNGLNFLSNSAFSIVEIYDTACLARNNGSFLTLLSADRAGLPESMNLDIKNFKEINKDLSKVVFDFSMTITWNSKIQPLKLADQDQQLVYMSCVSNQLLRSCQRWLDLKFLSIKHNRFVLKKINSIDNIAELIGLGEGLTPSGDDFIVGALNMAACFSTRLFIELKEKGGWRESNARHEISIRAILCIAGTTVSYFTIVH